MRGEDRGERGEGRGEEREEREESVERDSILLSPCDTFSKEYA